MKYSGFASFGWKNLGLFVCFWGGKRASATGLRKPKKLEENQKKQKNKVWGEMLYPKISSRGLVFLVFLVILVFLEGNGYRAEKNQKNSKKTKKNKKKQKNQSLGRNAIPKDFLQGIGFFGYFGFFRHFFAFRFMIL